MGRRHLGDSGLLLLCTLQVHREGPIMGKHGIIGDIIMWSFIGAFAVLVLTHYKGFASAVGTATRPIEYETGVIASAGTATKPAPSPPYGG